MTSPTPPLVLLFGPFDPTGSQGLPADAVTCANLGCHGLAVVTASTVQDTTTVEDVQASSPDLIDDQARCLLEDMSVQAIKVGELYTAEAVSTVAQIAADYHQIPLILHLGGWPPFFGDKADQEEGDNLLAATLELLVPQANVVVVEYTRLTRWLTEETVEMGQAFSPAHALLNIGANWVVVPGTPLRPGHYATLLIGANGSTLNLSWQAPPERSSNNGDLLATALTAFFARGMTMPQAAQAAVEHANAGIAASFLPGMGQRIASRISPGNDPPSIP